MKATIKVEKEVELDHIQVIAKVRYWEDAEVNGESDERGDLIPCREGENWYPIIDVSTGKIRNWQQGKTAKVHYKVCDCGVYRLLDAEGNIVGEIDGYVPGFMCPADNGYGDYIIMNIDADGNIEDWQFSKKDIESFTEQE